MFIYKINIRQKLNKQGHSGLEIWQPPPLAPTPPTPTRTPTPTPTGTPNPHPHPPHTPKK